MTISLLTKEEKLIAVPSTSSSSSSSRSSPSKQTPYLLSGTASLSKLLPTGTIFAFQSLAPAFANHGTCTSSNIYMSAFLVGLCTFICFFHSFTDTYISSNSRVYFGMATIKGLYIFNSSNTDEDKLVKDMLKKKKLFKLRFVDVVHALTSCVMFLTIAFADAEVQQCLVPQKYLKELRELFMNLPIGVGMLSGLIFLLFPTCRSNIGYTDTPFTEEDNYHQQHRMQSAIDYDMSTDPNHVPQPPNCSKKDLVISSV